MTAATGTQRLPRKILLATDLSARCDRAFDRAMELAAEWQAELVAVHVMEDAGAELPAGQDTLPSWRRGPDARQIAEMRARSDLREIASGFAIVIEWGDPAEAILRTAKAHGCDLIVTGVARYEPLGRIALGSTVTQLTRRSEVPVLIVRKRGRRPYRHVVVATDFSDSSRHALEAAARFFPNGSLTIFNAYDAPMALLVSDPAAHRAQFRTVAEQEGKVFLAASALPDRAEKPEVLLEHGDPDRLIRDYAADKDVDLVALATHGRGAVFHALIGSVARNLIESLPCDVLVVPAPATSAAS